MLYRYIHIIIHGHVRYTYIHVHVYLVTGWKGTLYNSKVYNLYAVSHTRLRIENTRTHSIHPYNVHVHLFLHGLFCMYMYIRPYRAALKQLVIRLQPIIPYLWYPAFLTAQTERAFQSLCPNDSAAFEDTAILSP